MYKTNLKSKIQNSESFFKINNLFASVDTKNVINDLNLEVRKGETHIIMGPNGSGKSSLTNVIMGHPRFKIKKGKIFFEQIDITKLETNKRAELGIFLSFQYPKEISGLSVESFLRTAYVSLNKARDPEFSVPSVFKFKKILLEVSEQLGIKAEFLERELNKGFSGGEKKKMEIMQAFVLKPKFIILDEIDSGLDVDALKIVTKAINLLKKNGVTLLLITHYYRILQYIIPDFVHLVIEGKIVKSGNKDFAIKLEKEGYDKYL